MSSIFRVVFLWVGTVALWTIGGAPADAREDPMARYGCHRHHFHHHTHAGYHCSTGPLAGQDFDSKSDLVKALKAQGIDPNAKKPAPKPKEATTPQ